MDCEGSVTSISTCLFRKGLSSSQATSHRIGFFLHLHQCKFCHREKHFGLLLMGFILLEDVCSKLQPRKSGCTVSCVWAGLKCNLLFITFTWNSSTCSHGLVCQWYNQTHIQLPGCLCSRKMSWGTGTVLRSAVSLLNVLIAEHTMKRNGGSSGGWKILSLIRQVEAWDSGRALSSQPSTSAIWQYSSVQTSNGFSTGTHASQTPSFECLRRANRQEMGSLGKGKPFPNCQQHSST